MRQELAPWPTVGACSTGICREDPIPPGIYWIDSVEPAAFGADEEEVQHARELYMRRLDSQNPGAYRIIRTVAHDDGQYDRDWILFQVTAPIPRWPSNAHWGLPTVAPNGANTQEGDTVQRPPPEPGLFEDETLGIPTWALFAGSVVVLGVVVYAASR